MSNDNHPLPVELLPNEETAKPMLSYASPTRKNIIGKVINWVALGVAASALPYFLNKHYRGKIDAIDHTTMGLYEQENDIQEHIPTVQQEIAQLNKQRSMESWKYTTENIPEVVLAAGLTTQAILNKRRKQWAESKQKI